jgi:hypothetical protein
MAVEQVLCAGWSGMCYQRSLPLTSEQKGLIINRLLLGIFFCCCMIWSAQAKMLHLMCSGTVEKDLRMSVVINFDKNTVNGFSNLALDEDKILIEKIDDQRIWFKGDLVVSKHLAGHINRTTGEAIVDYHRELRREEVHPPFSRAIILSAG